MDVTTPIVQVATIAAALFRNLRGDLEGADAPRNREKAGGCQGKEEKRVFRIFGPLSLEPVAGGADLRIAACAIYLKGRGASYVFAGVISEGATRFRPAFFAS